MHSNKAKRLSLAVAASMEWSRLISQLRIVRAHPLQCLAPDHEKARPGIANLDETAVRDHRVRIVDLEYVFQRRRGGIGTRGFDTVFLILSQSMRLIG